MRENDRTWKHSRPNGQQKLVVLKASDHVPYSLPVEINTPTPSTVLLVVPGTVDGMILVPADLCFRSYQWHFNSAVYRYLDDHDVYLQRYNTKSQTRFQK